MEDVRVALDLHVARHGHRARPRYTTKVVAPKIDEHDVLGALLGVALELVGDALIVGVVDAARSRARDGVRRHPVAVDLQEQLRAGADDLVVRGTHEEEVRAGIDPAKRAIEADAIETPTVGAARQGQRLAAREHDLDGLAGRDGVLGSDDGRLVRLTTEAGLDRAFELDGHRRTGTGAGARGRGQLRDRGSGGPLEGLEDGSLGDPVATLEVGRGGLERGDGAQRVGQVVEDEDEVGFKEGCRRDADVVDVGQGHRLELADGVVRQGADGAAGEARHALQRHDRSSRHERPDGGDRIRHLERLAGQAGVEDILGEWPIDDARRRPADLQRPPRADAKERVTPDALAALDRLEQVGRPAIVHAQEGPDRGLQVGVATGA